jgi:hypothetical protein
VAAEEKQLHNKAMEDGGIYNGRGGVGRVFPFFSFLGGDKSYLQSYPLLSYQKWGVIFGIFGGHFCYN